MDTSLRSLLPSILSVLLLIVNNNPSDVPFDQSLAPLHNIERLCVQGVNNYTSISDEYRNHLTRPANIFLVDKQVNPTGAEKRFLNEVGNKTSIFKILLGYCEEFDDNKMANIHEKYGNYRHICRNRGDKAVYLFAGHWIRLESNARRTNSTEVITGIAECIIKCKMTAAHGDECDECSTCLNKDTVPVRRRIPLRGIFEILGVIVGLITLAILVDKARRDPRAIRQFISGLRLQNFWQTVDGCYNSIPLEDLGESRNSTAIQIEDFESEGNEEAEEQDDDEGDAILFYRPMACCSPGALYFIDGH